MAAAAADPIPLLGPPELRRHPVVTAASSVVDTLAADIAKTTVDDDDDPNPNAPLMRMVLTENMSATFLSSGNPCLDFFYHVVPDTPPESLVGRLSLAWTHDPLTALKLVCNLRGVRGTGKSDKEGYYAAALWLHGNHPRTLAGNVGSLAGFGYFKDLPEILYRLFEGLDVRERNKEEWRQRQITGGPGVPKRKKVVSPRRRRGRRGGAVVEKKEKKERVKKPSRFAPTKEAAREKKEKERLSLAKRVLEQYAGDDKFRSLHDKISDLFADHLRLDLEFLKSGNVNRISLAAKWCPSLDSLFDRHTLLCESIARRVFPRESFPEYEGIEEAHYAYRIRNRLRKEVLVPLRKALELPEVYIGANQWHALPYNRVASVAMKTYKRLFVKHDGERFLEYLSSVAKGEAKIAAGALLPHEIIAELDRISYELGYLKYDRYGYCGYNYGSDDEDDEEEDKEDEEGDKEDEDEEKKGKKKEKEELEAELKVVELQWKRMVEDLAKKGKLKNCLGISDVSGSMSGIPMDVAVALGLLVSELSEGPWEGKLITFSADPQLHVIKGDNLRSKVKFIKEMDWGMNTDFQKVFDLILEVAVQGNLKEEDMIKRVFVFSDMEFDQASANPWETDYMAIKRKFGEKGYGAVVPEIVFWNLRDSRATPVPGNQEGVALVSGFSKNLLTLFLDGGGIVNPEAIMESAISGQEYQKLVVLD